MNRLPKPRVTAVQETDVGVYVWKMPSGQYVGDGDGRYLCVRAREHDVSAMSALRKAVRYYKIEEGEPHFLAGRRGVSDTEHDDQMERLIDGKIPDPFSEANLND